MPSPASLHQVSTPNLHIAYEEHGPRNGEPVILLHGFPYDVRAYDEIAPPLPSAAIGSSFPTCGVTARRALPANR